MTSEYRLRLPGFRLASCKDLRPPQQVPIRVVHPEPVASEALVLGKCGLPLPLRRTARPFNKTDEVIFNHRVAPRVLYDYA